MSKPTGVRLSLEARELVRALIKATGMPWSMVIEQAVRSYAKKILVKSQKTT